MARSVSISTTLAEVTPYWEPALWVLIVVVTAGIVGSALWAPSRSGRRRGRRKLSRRSDVRVRSEERRASSAVMVPATAVSHADDASAPVDFYAEPATADDAEAEAEAEAEAVADTAEDIEATAVTAAAAPAVAAETSAGVPAADDGAPTLFDEVIEAPAPAAPVAGSVDSPAAETEAVPSPALVSMVANGDSAPEPVTEPPCAVSAVAFADVEAGFARLTSDVSTLADEVTFFDERSTVPPAMPSWPVEHQETLAERAAEALADPLDQLLERSLTVASDVRALDRLLGGRFHDEDAAQAIVANRIEIAGLRRHLGRVNDRFLSLAGGFPVLSGTSEQLAKVASIVDATDAVMASWEPTMVETARTASAHR